MLQTTQVFSLQSGQFEEFALKTFRFQAANCAVYRDFIAALGKNPEKVHSLAEIPFLPIEFFKNKTIIAEGFEPQITFTSSGTTGMQQSKHHVAALDWYVQSFLTAFTESYGNPNELTILALLPAYQEREGSSLIYMVDELLKRSGKPQSGYVLNDTEALYNTLLALKAANEPTLLIGVTYALLDFVETHQIEFPELIVMETGGMKGRRKEMIREELHSQLCKGFGVSKIHSEYGMTELLSQGYSKGDGIFTTPSWMKILIRDTNDPFSFQTFGRTGGINVIDLANQLSCSFIATQDLGKVYEDGTFEVLGRFDNSDIRGCNLLVQ